MRLVVTGGAGYIGSVVTRQLGAAGHEVTVVDDLSTGHADAVPDGVRLVDSDIRDIGPVLAEGGFDGVLHFAAKALVRESVAHPRRYWHDNVAASLELLDAMVDAGVPRLVFSSTCAVYGEPEQLPIRETTPARPTNPYGASKLAVDHAITSYAHAYGLAAVSLRYFNVAGSFGGAGEDHDPETHIIPNTLRVAAGDGDALHLFGDDYDTPDGTCIRDYVHVAELGEAHLLALDAATGGEHQILNLGSGTGYSVVEVIEAVRAVTGHPVPVRIAPRRPGDPARLVASNERIRTALGWAPHRGLEEMVRDAWTFEQQRRAAVP